MALNVGDLKFEVTIEQLTDSTETTGFPIEGWATLCTAWMSRETARGNERFATGQLAASTTRIWTMRYRADMDPDLVDVPKTRRLVYQSRTYDIEAADHLGRKDGIALSTLAGEV